jgi:hypothetical protein
MPYAITVAVCALIGFVFGGLFLNVIVAWIATFASFAVAMIVLPRLYAK